MTSFSFALLASLAALLLVFSCMIATVVHAEQQQHIAFQGGDESHHFIRNGHRRHIRSLQALSATADPSDIVIATDPSTAIANSTATATPFAIPIGVTPSSANGTTVAPPTTTTTTTVAAAAPIVVVGRIKEMRWINADTNQRIVIAGSNVVPIHRRPYGADVLNGYDVPNCNLSMEAIVDATIGPVGSIRFTYTAYDMNRTTITTVENTPPYALCSNQGPDDFVPCAGLREYGGEILAQVYSGQHATGVASETIWSTYIRYTYPVAPYGTLVLFDADSDTKLATSNMGRAVDVVNITETPHIAVWIDAWSGRYRWAARSAVFNYDDGAIVVHETSPPLVFPGNTGRDYWNSFAPSVGNHTLTATLYSKKHWQGQNVTWTMRLQVVA